ncbi:probable serine/threonine-protein kinase pats1 [Ruditapes philippinarum]|uniref:probable serine/threonine-protein kinase pats1 n=1 Tax=Ruditapes philippinarum TaxID=129788 RepID=UPI00295C1478|nr:probable serine/threonine-protein kinase pats1 [Ruditapes philippinarum]
MDCSSIIKRLASVAQYLKDKASLFESTEKNNDDEIKEDLQDTEMIVGLIGEHNIQKDSEKTLKSSEPESKELPDAIDASYKMSDEICSEGSNDDSLGRRSILSDVDKIQFAQELSRENSKEGDDNMDISVEFWDFGGQFVFYATHMIFHSRKAIYLLVLDLTSHLNEIAVDQDFPTESHERSMAYYVRFWINSIHSFVGSEDGVEPTVILVGTHKDKLRGNVDQKIETFFENIRKLFDGTKLLKHIYRKDFAVDNTVTDDEGVTALREAVIEIGREKAKTVEIPAKWIHLEKSLKEKIHLKIITFQDVRTIDALNEYPLGSNDQVRIFLQYHHSKGTFIYFDEDPISYYVVLDPQYLIDAFKCLITSEQFCKKDPDIRPSFNKLHDEGRLEKELVDKLWSKDKELMYMENREILLDFLAKHHIISEATKYEEDTKKSSGLGWFVVPSLLRDLYPSDEFEQLLCGRRQSALRFVMEFEISTIIPTIYHRLVAAIVGKWPIIHFRDKPVMYKNLCAARLENNHIGFAEMRSETIELSVANLCSKDAIDGGRCDRLRRFVEAVIEHEFHKLKCSKETCVKLYAIKFRCNHEIHGVNGSKDTIEWKQVGTTKQIPCPDFESHASITADGFTEWYIDHRIKIQIPKKGVTEKLLSQISKEIGHNWQTLGHELGVTKVQIEQIIEDNPHSTSMKIFAMLTKWSQNVEIATFDVLVESMQKCPTLNVDWGEIRNILDSLE